MYTGWGCWSDASYKRNKVCPPTKASRKEKRSKYTVNKQQDKKVVKHMVGVVYVAASCLCWISCCTECKKKIGKNIGIGNHTHLNQLY